jgi:hypothetical protein
LNTQYRISDGRALLVGSQKCVTHEVSRQQTEGVYENGNSTRKSLPLLSLMWGIPVLLHCSWAPLLTLLLYPKRVLEVAPMVAVSSTPVIRCTLLNAVTLLAHMTKASTTGLICWNIIPIASNCINMGKWILTNSGMDS